MCYYSKFDMYEEDEAELELLDEYGQYLDDVCICNQSDDCMCMSFEQYKDKIVNEMLEDMSAYYAI
jgi:hypothetical protein